MGRSPNSSSSTTDQTAEDPSSMFARDLTRGFASLKADLGSLAEFLRSEIHRATETVTQAQSAATTAHGEILRTLTEAIFASSSTSGSLDAAELESMLMRFEDRITATIRESGNAAARVDAPPAAAASGDSAAASGSKPKPVSVSGSRSWDEIRRAFLNDSTDLGTMDGVTAPPSAATATRTSLNRSDPPRVSEPSAAPEPEVPLEVPEQVDIDSLSEPELREALYGRDKLISALISRLRRQSYGQPDQMSADQLQQLSAQLPEELARRVNATLQRMDEQLRLGELELSLERARIARQMSHLEYSRQQIEHNARQLGWTINSDGTVDSSSVTVTRGSGSRRWLGKLGFGES